MYPDPGAEAGFALAGAELDPPAAGSVEAALIDAGAGDGITLTDLRRSPRDGQGKPLLQRIRSQSAVLSPPVP